MIKDFQPGSLSLVEDARREWQELASLGGMKRLSGGREVSVRVHGGAMGMM